MKRFPEILIDYNSALRTRLSRLARAYSARGCGTADNIRRAKASHLCDSFQAPRATQRPAARRLSHPEHPRRGEIRAGHGKNSLAGTQGPDVAAVGRASRADPRDISDPGAQARAGARRFRTRAAIARAGKRSV